ncbi:GGDEF domain-containing protein [Sporosarcina sp. BI001-red]|uniref:GGDEF domain-containing protein n=1 Tax=Sporosarcina sp. BI001-red TaxID=2282866 RepID=UPI000E257A7B|nr:GGDEF domain-containing protein [Sporosarcina sp. BI001-red]REB08698.1 GGDEF domain-containing protein [Sporosarcina sp. BI001-red]
MMSEHIQKLQKSIQTLRNHGKYNEMIEACYQLLQSATDLEDRQLQMNAYANFALGFYKIGDIKDAFFYIEKHAMLCEIYGDKEDEMDSNHIFFMLYEYIGNYVKAKQVLENSIELATKLKKYNLVSENCSELSSVLSRMGKYEEALIVGKKGARIAARHEPYCPFLFLKAILSVAQALLGMAELEEVDSLLQTVVRDRVLQDYSIEKTKCYRLLAHLQRLQQNPQDALESLTIAKESAKNSNNFKQQKEIQEVQIELYRELKDFEKGFDIQEEHIQLLKEIHRHDAANAAMKLEMKVKLQDLERQANTDFLTGVSSRRALEETANEWLAQAPLFEENIVCITFDIDNLKKLNDTFGHLFGDQVIRRVAQECSNLLRRSDKTGRVGGDEFVSILKGISIEDGMKKAQQMLDAVTQLSVEHNGKNIPLTLSIGVAENYHGSIKEYNKLYHKADIALYRAKNNGKNRVCIY